MIVSKASRRVWMGTAIVAALAAGVLLGGSFASWSEALVQAPAQNFTGDAGLVLHVVNPASATDFENLQSSCTKCNRSHKYEKKHCWYCGHTQLRIRKTWLWFCFAFILVFFAGYLVGMFA